MIVEWLSEAQFEFREFLGFYKTTVGTQAALRFSNKILGGVKQLEQFPESGTMKQETLLGRYGFRVLFIDHFACIYRIDLDRVLIYHLADARTNYIYRIFGLTPED